ncbi:olfactory receptor 8H1-like [Spea bombifrons]|uniref:olfactory receptor 8H1-like n=1 Tax=Spea bombifrons TaxID=233779 RepID=UPI00234A6D75|nr:olfactory receptor 8H1-like [Spea bombifrons]
MARSNVTEIAGFILLGLTDSHVIRLYLFGMFFLIYLFTILGNTTIIVIITLVTQLYSPMYFFLRNLSFTELCYISVTVPRMLRDFLQSDNFISFLGCATQLYFFCFLGTTECFLLATMAYDRYIAICQPLLYMSIMTKKQCFKLSLGCVLAAMTLSLGQITFVFSLPFCGLNIIDHFFCDILPVVGLVCGDTYVNEMAIFMYGSLVIASPFVLILVSYVQILAAVFRIDSTVGRHKAFATCGSHLMSVTLFYGTATVTYLRTKSNYTTGEAKLMSLLYSIFIPMLNPLIYSLRNSQVKNAIETLFVKLKEKKKWTAQ